MGYYYVGLESRSHSFLLERRLKNVNVQCEITYMPREIMSDTCNLGVRFHDSVFKRAMEAIRNCGLPGCRVYKEINFPDGNYYHEIEI